MKARLFVLLVFAAAATALHAQQGGGNQPGTTWTEAKLRDAVDLARVGRKLTPKSWSNGPHAASVLTRPPRADEAAR